MWLHKLVGAFTSTATDTDFPTRKDHQKESNKKFSVQYADRTSSTKENYRRRRRERDSKKYTTKTQRSFLFSLHTMPCHHINSNGFFSPRGPCLLKLSCSMEPHHINPSKYSVSVAQKMASFLPFHFFSFASMIRI